MKPRAPEALAACIVSLAQDAGAVGEQVRTFIVGDDIESVAESLRERLQSLEVPSEYEQRHASGREIGVRLEFIIDSVPRAQVEKLLANDEYGVRGGLTNVIGGDIDES